MGVWVEEVLKQSVISVFLIPSAPSNEPTITTSNSTVVVLRGQDALLTCTAKHLGKEVVSRRVEKLLCHNLQVSLHLTTVYILHFIKWRLQSTIVWMLHRITMNTWQCPSAVYTVYPCLQLHWVFEIDDTLIYHDQQLMVDDPRYSLLHTNGTSLRMRHLLWGTRYSLLAVVYFRSLA